MSTALPTPLASDAPSPGTILAGKYEVVRELGRGGMGLVLEARHLRLGQNVAVKLLLPEMRFDREVTSRFEREARAAARLTGPHVARVLDVDILADQSPFLVMELLRGRELGEELDERGPLPVREAVSFVLEACSAMAEAHRMGIVHRDLKPANLFLADAGGRRTVKVLDFGISKVAGDINANVTTTATAFGTPLYMSPEQVRSAKNVDARSDIWSLGVILYELLSGQPPFDAPSATAILAAIIADAPTPLSEIRTDVPAALSGAVMRALSKNPDTRYPDVASFAAAIAPSAGELAPSDAVPSVRVRPVDDPRSAKSGNVGDELSEARTLLRTSGASRSAFRWGILGGGAFAAVGVVAVLVFGRGSNVGAAPDPMGTASPQESTGASARPEAPPPIAPTAAGPDVQIAPPAPIASATPTVTPAGPVPSARSGRPAPTARAPSSPPAQPTAQPTAPPKVTPAPTTDPKYL